MSAVPNESAEPRILIEFVERPGIRQVALTPKELSAKSAEAFQGALAQIREVATEVQSRVDSLARRPSEIEVAFGFKFDAEAGAFIAKAGAEASLSVKLVWND